MDYILQFLLTLISTLLAMLLIICLYQSKTPTAHKRKSSVAPHAGGGWPIIGHLHLLGGREVAHKTLASMADKYGPAFTIKLGSYGALVVSSSELARECYTIHDKVFATRPSVAAARLMGYNDAMFGFAPHGSYWREVRKIVTSELLSNRGLDVVKHIRVLEVENWIRELHKKWSTKSGILVDITHSFEDLIYNVAVRMVGGKRYSGASANCEEAEARRCQKVMGDFFNQFGVFMISDVIPFLGWLDYLRGCEKTMKRTAKEVDNLIGGWLEEHKQKRLLGAWEEKEDQDFMDVMLTILQDVKISGFDADTIIKATCQNLIAGSDTIMVTLTWALSLLLNNGNALKKAQDELDIHVGKDRHVDESDIRNLVYLQSIVKETLRHYPPGPILTFRAALEDCTLSNGYHIPAETRLMVNAWKIQHDERLWPNPHEFQPERFLTSHKNINVRGQNFELIPFGSGRRSCPAISLSLQMVHLTLASLLHCFEVAKPSDEGVDMTETTGLSNVKATPLEVLLTPRLNSKLYSQ